MQTERGSMSINKQETFLEEFRYKQSISAYTNLTDREKEIHQSAFMTGYKLGQEHMKKLRQKVKIIHVKSDSNKEHRDQIFLAGTKQARDIFHMVIKYFDRSYEEIVSPRRLAEYAEVRSVIANLLREMTTLSLPEIGKVLGGRDHTTVLHHLRLKTDKKRFWKEGSRTWKHYDNLVGRVKEELGE